MGDPDANKKIVGMMAFAAVFAIIGHTKKTGAQGSSVTQSLAGSASDAKIVLGAGIGTVLLVLLASAGSGAAAFAKGLAGVTLVSSILINGTEVFSAVSSVTGSGKLPSPTSPVGAKP